MDTWNPLDMPYYENWSPSFMRKVVRADAMLSPVLDRIEAGSELSLDWRDHVFRSGVGSLDERWLLGRALCAKFVEESSRNSYLQVYFRNGKKETVKVRIPGLNVIDRLETSSKFNTFADQGNQDQSWSLRLEADAFFTAARIALFRGQKKAARQMLKEAGAIYLRIVQFEKSVLFEMSM